MRLLLNISDPFVSVAGNKINVYMRYCVICNLKFFQAGIYFLLGLEFNEKALPSPSAAFLPVAIASRVNCPL